MPLVQCTTYVVIKFNLFLSANARAAVHTAASSSLAQNVANVFARSSNALSETPFRPHQRFGRSAGMSSSRQSVQQAPRNRRKATTVKAAKVVFLRDCKLPRRLTKDLVLLESIIELSNDHSESEIKDRLITVLHSVEQHADVVPAQLRFLSYCQKEVTAPTVPSDFEWKGSIVKAVMGQGRLYVLVAGTTEVGIAFVPSFKTCYCLV